MPGQTPLPDGTTLQNGTYLIESHLGTGGFGVTYRAQEPKQNRVVAIKEFYPVGCARQGKRLAAGGDWDEDYLDQYKNTFLEECRVLTSLQHPGIVRVHRFFLENNSLYLVMEFIQGQTLSQYQRAWLREKQRPLPIEEALSLVRQAGEALTVVHGKDLLHRDLKPGNIMRRANGQAVLIDFGATREVLPDMEISHTPILTPGYAPPEQYPRQAMRGAYTDVYALAATLYKLLTGEPPVESKLRDLFPLPPPRSLRPEIPDAVSEAVMWGMELKAAERAQTVGAFLGALFPLTGTVPPVIATVPPVAAVSPPMTNLSAPPAVLTTPSRSISQAEATWINPIDGAEMILIPAGAFLMGITEAEIEDLIQAHPTWKQEWFEDERPQRQVYLEAYSLYKTPVSVAQYRTFCEAARRQMPEAPAWGWYNHHPIVNVSWEDAKAYCDWAGMSLPTEAQWEKAARGTEGQRYPWGNAWDSRKCQCSKQKSGDANSTAPIGSYLLGASPFGVLDMAGNVWEWCYDWYEKDYYKSAPSNHPTGPATGERRALRGGCWNNFEVGDFRCSYREWGSPTVGSVNGGFRCVSRESSKSISRR